MVSYYLPAKEGGKVLCIGPAAQIKDIIQSAGGAPRVSRYMERMIRYTDGDRDLTLLFLPPYLLSDGKSFFSGALGGIASAVCEFLRRRRPGCNFELPLPRRSVPRIAVAGLGRQGSGKSVGPIRQPGSGVAERGRK